MAETLIATAAGEFGTSFLAKEATKIGIKQFIQTYGSVAFRTVSPVIMGGMLFEKVVEAYPPIDIQNEKLLGMPVSHIARQEQAYDDTKYFKKPEPLKYIPTVHGGDKLPPVEQEYFPVEDKITTQDESFKIPEKIETNKGFEVPPQEKKFPPGFEIPKTVDTSILTKDKPKDITKQTEELVPKIKNKITTWELLADTKEEFKKLAEENKISVEELEKGTIQKQIKFKKFGKHFDVYFNNKKIAELVNITQEVREDESSWRPKNINTYNLVYLTEGGYFDNGVDTIDGIENAKNSTMQYISNDLMDETKSDKYALGFTSLREIFQEMEYNKKGQPVTEGERTSDITKQTKDLVTKEPEFGALTETEKQTAIALKGDKPDFYSRAIEAIKTAKDDKYTKGKWASILKSSTTKEELDYLGLTDFLKGNESITKQELLNLVKDKDIAATMTVRTVPKDQMNSMWDDYSLGGAQEGTVEHIVFQKRKDADFVIHPAAGIYKEPHFNAEYGTDTFAHARTQVGYSPKLIPNVMEDAGDMEYNNWATEISEIFKNIQIVDETQSKHIQEIQEKGSAKDWTIIKGSDVTKEFIEENFGNIYELKISKYATVKQTLEKTGLQSNKVLYMKPSAAKSLNPQVVTRIDDDIYYTFDTKNLQGGGFDTEELAKSYVKREAIPDLPIKDTKKFVELVLNEMIRKAVIDGRDSIAITNGQIQYNRYPAMEEKKRQGLKKVYDTIHYDQLNKIAKNYGIKLEKINIENPEQAEMDQSETQMQFPRKVKTAQDNGYILKKITFQELFDRVQDTDIPGHAALYNNEGRGQGHDYIEEWFNTLIDNRTGGIPATLTTEEGLSGSGLKRWEKIRTNEVYVWKKGTNDIGEEGVISWDMPIVPVKDTLTNPAVNDMLNASSKDREYILKQFTIGGAAGYPYAGENINNIDLIKYTEYLRNYKPPEGIDLGYDKDAEQLIKMKFPKKLKKDFYGKRIKLTKKINQQTDRMFG